MALLLNTRRRAQDSLGNPYVGATLTVYEAGTTTPAAIYREAALSDAMTNPTSGADVSDADGWFPQMFGTEGALVDVTMKTAGGVVIQSEESVPLLGQNSGTITRDFGLSRMAVRGSGGRVYWESGDASGDDTGGKFTLGGWSGTQADDGVIDAAALTTTGTLDTGGTITEDGKPLSGVVRSVAAFSSSAEVVIPLAGLSPGIRMFDVDIIEMALVGTPPSLKMEFSFDGGATWAAGSNSYTYNNWYHNTSNAVVSAGPASGTAIAFPSITSGYSAMFLRFVTPFSTGLTSVQWDAWNPASTGQFNRVQGAGQYTVSSGPITHVRLSSASGNMAGRYRVVPQRGF